MSGCGAWTAFGGPSSRLWLGPGTVGTHCRVLDTLHACLVCARCQSRGPVMQPGPGWGPVGRPGKRAVRLLWGEGVGVGLAGKMMAGESCAGSRGRQPHGAVT